MLGRALSYLAEGARRTLRSRKRATCKEFGTELDKNVPIDESGKEIAPSELGAYLETHRTQVPEKVAVILLQDKDFKRLLEKDPVKAHDLATEAATLGQDKVGVVLRTIREHPKRERTPRPPVSSLLEIVIEAGFSWDMLDALERYRKEQNLPDALAAARSILFDWLKRQTHDCLDLRAAVEGIIIEFLQNKGYTAAEKKVKG